MARIFEQLADLLEFEGANPFRVRAYRNAAQTVRDLPRSVADVVAGGEDLTELPGIGDDLAGKIAEIVRTGHLGVLDELTARLGAGLADLLLIPGLGPRRARALHERLGVGSIPERGAPVRAGRVRALAGFGPKMASRTPLARVTLRCRAADLLRGRSAIRPDPARAIQARQRHDAAGHRSCQAPDRRDLYFWTVPKR